jgi:hypothetical protein
MRGGGVQQVAVRKGFGSGRSSVTAVREPRLFSVTGGETRRTTGTRRQAFWRDLIEDPGPSAPFDEPGLRTLAQLLAVLDHHEN